MWNSNHCATANTDSLDRKYDGHFVWVEEKPARSIHPRCVFKEFPSFGRLDKRRIEIVTKVLKLIRGDRER